MAKPRKPSSASGSRDAATRAKTRDTREAPAAKSEQLSEGKTQAEAEADAIRHGEFNAVSRDSATPLEPVPLQERQRMIAEAAYRCYQQRDQAHGSSLDDWLKAETEVDQMLASRAPAHRNRTH